MAISITCPVCQQAFPVPSEVLSVDTETNLVMVRMDRSELFGHLRQCAQTHPLPPAVPAKVEPAPQPVVQPAYVAPGKRACTMCGTHNTTCLTGLQTTQAPCCPPCGGGNTHPVPRERDSCAQWGAEHGAPNRA